MRGGLMSIARLHSEPSQREPAGANIRGQSRQASTGRSTSIDALECVTP